MFCSKCGTENSETASFCSKCGEPINGAVTPVAKKKNKFLWIGGAILAVFLLCCVAPLGYGYVKLKSIPTSTPFLRQLQSQLKMLQVLLTAKRS